MDIQTEDKKSAILPITSEENVANQVKPENPNIVNPETEETLEDLRMGKRNPFLTLLSLIPGPLCAQISQASYGLLNTFWIARSQHPEVNIPVSIAYPVCFFITAFAQVFNIMVSDRVSYLYAKKEQDECAQVVVDIIRFTFIAGAILPAIMLPCCKPIMKWYNGTSQNQADFFYYMLPQFSCCLIVFVYFTICGLTQALGNSFVSAICHISSALLNGLVFVPLLVNKVDSGAWGASIGNAISNFIPCFILFVCLFVGKFDVKPKMKMFCQRFNQNSFKALKMSLGQLIAQLAFCVPMLLVTKMIEKTGSNDSSYDVTLMAWNVVGRTIGFVGSICNGLNQGLLPAASYAYGRNKYRRLRILAFIVLIVGTILSLIIEIVIELLPERYANLFNEGEDYILMTKKMMHIAISTVFVTQINATTIVMLQAVKLALASIICAILKDLLPLPIASLIFYLTNRNDPIRMMWAFVTADLFSLIVVVIAIVWKLRFIFKDNIPEISPTEAKKKQLREEILP